MSVVYSARAFVLLWAALTAAVVAYAVLDLHLSPSLWQEQHFSMEPDLSQLWEARHWGGRLVREGHWALLLPNALVLGGIGALGLHGLGRFIARRRGQTESEPAPDSLAPVSLHSIPPPAP